MSLLAVSGGRRATDLVEIFPDWTSESTGDRIKTHLLVRGVQHLPGADARIEGLRSGELLQCTRDLENPINPQAIRLLTEDGVDIGFVPDYLAADLTALLDHGAEIDDDHKSYEWPGARPRPAPSVGNEVRVRDALL